MERIFTLNRSKGPVISCKRGWGREEGGGGRGRMEDLMKDLQGEWREDQSLPKKYKSGYYKKLTVNFLPMR